MSKELARVAIMEAAILKELGAANDHTRQALGEILEPGDRMAVTVDGHDLGYVQRTKPRKVWKVQEWGEFTRWVEQHAPDQIVTTTQVSPAFIQRLLSVGEYITAEGEVLIPDGLGASETTSQLRVSPSDDAHELARSILNRVPELPRGQM